jgi:glutamine cyclotransferase
LHEYPHDPAAFTQGLLYRDGYLYESTGLTGRSTLRKVDLDTGRVLQEFKVPNRLFAEGLTDWRHHLVQLTWQAHTGFVYDLATFAKLREFSYPTEGWGLTHDDSHLIMSDGSSNLRYLDPTTFETVRTLRVTASNGPLKNLNELEYIRGEIYANIWETDLIARISPDTGKVLDFIDLSGLLPDRDRTAETNVLNGIAYDSQNNRIFVTGKFWPKLFEIQVVDRQ